MVFHECECVRQRVRQASTIFESFFYLQPASQPASQRIRFGIEKLKSQFPDRQISAVCSIRRPAAENPANRPVTVVSENFLHHYTGGGVCNFLLALKTRDDRFLCFASFVPCTAYASQFGDFICRHTGWQLTSLSLLVMGSG